MPIFEYSAFISYARKDKLWAKWLKRKLENSPLPVNPTYKDHSRIYDGAEPCLEGLPCRHPRHALRDVFLDERNAGNGELSDVLRRNIAKSKFLIVICSPAAKQSRWVAREIACFKELNPDTYRQRIIPLIVEGHVDDQRGINECFPEGLNLTTLGSVVKGRHALHVGSERRAVRLLDSATRLSIALAGKDLALSRIAASLLGIDNPDSIYKSRRRAVRRRRRFVFLLLLTVLAGCLGYYFRYVHTYTRYYTNYVERNGIPEGMHPLRRSELPLQYQYYEFKVRDRRVRELRCRDGWGEPAEAMQPGIWNRYPRLVYEYTPEGFVSKIRCRNNDRHESVVTFPGTSRDNIQLLAPSGESTYLLNNESKTSSRLHYLRTRRNARGEIVRVNFHANTDPESLGETSEGISGIVFERDSAGLVRSMQAVDSRGNGTWFCKGVAATHFTYDAMGRCTGQAFFSDNGAPVCNSDLVHSLQYSGLGTDSVTTANFGTDGQIGLNRACYAFCSRVTRDKVQTIYYFDRDQRPVLTKSLVAGYRQERIPNGFRTTCFDRNGNPGLCRDGYAVKTIRTTGDTTITAYYDLQMRLALSRSNACAIEKRTRTGKNAFRYEYYLAPEQRCCRLVSEQYYNERMLLDSCALLNNSDPLDPLRGIQFMKSVCDHFGNTTEKRCYDRFGSLVEKTFYEYDERGNIIRLYHVDALFRPVAKDTDRPENLPIQSAPETYHRMQYRYDKYGQTVTTEFYDTSQNLIHRTSFGYDPYGNILQKRIEPDSGDTVLLRFRYDSSGRYPIEFAVYDRTQTPKEIDGVARTEYRYDQRGNIIETTHYDACNRPAVARTPDSLAGNDCRTSIRNFCRAQQIYDQRDNCIELRLFDDRMRPYATETHGSVIKYRFNARDQMIETANFHLGKPYAARDFHKECLEYSDQTPVAIRFYNAKGEPANTSRGFAEIRIDEYMVTYFDVRGRMKESRFFADPLNRRYPIERHGVHRRVFVYDSCGQPCYQMFFDAQGQRIGPASMDRLFRTEKR